MENRKVLIWGAGKIGRGFIAPLFINSGYRVSFLDSNREFLHKLYDAKSYPVKVVSADGSSYTLQMEGYGIVELDDRSQLAEFDLIIISVPVSALSDVAFQLAEILKVRQSRKGSLGEKGFTPVDIILCTNILHPADSFKNYLYEGLVGVGLVSGKREAVDFVERNVGIVESLVIRMAPTPPEELLRENPLYVVTDDYPELPVDGGAFKNGFPPVKGLNAVSNMRAEETRKLYTYNLAHAVLAYVGATRGYEMIAEAVDDPVVRDIAIGALKEVGKALVREFGFTSETMEEWNKTVIRRIKNPALRDSIGRIGADPIRKLKKGDRLIGPAKLALSYGVKPINILKGVAAGFLFDNPDDAGAMEIQKYLSEEGIDRTIERFSGLDWRNGSDDYYMVKQIKSFYYGFKLGKRAYRLGFDYERDYHGCGQCALGAILDALGYEADKVFKATTAFAGGIGEKCDGSCGGYVAGVLAMGLAIGRRKDHFGGDREEKYKTAELARALRERFIAKYGSVTCRDIHASVFGRSFDLTVEGDRKIFDEMGAHTTKCTSVVADSARWAVEILFEFLGEEYLREELGIVIEGEDSSLLGASLP